MDGQSVRENKEALELEVTDTSEGRRDIDVILQSFTGFHGPRSPR
jgi:hypothetical protein